MEHTPSVDRGIDRCILYVMSALPDAYNTLRGRELGRRRIDELTQARLTAANVESFLSSSCPTPFKPASWLLPSYTLTQ